MINIDNIKLNKGTKRYIIPYSNVNDIIENNSNSNDNCSSTSNSPINEINLSEYAYHQSVKLKSNQNSKSNRQTIIAKDWNEFEQENPMKIKSEPISKSDDNQSPSIIIDDNDDNITKKKIIMLISGQGSHHLTMGMELYNQFPVYRETVDTIDNLFRPYIGYSLVEKLANLPPDSNEFYDQRTTHHALFALQIGLIHLHKHFGIEADIVVALSFGEVAALYVSGCIDLPTAVRIIHFRSIYQYESMSTGGKVIVVGTNLQIFNSRFNTKICVGDDSVGNGKDGSSNEKCKIICEEYPSLEFSGLTGAHLILSGNDNDIDRLNESLRGMGIPSYILPLPGMAHSSAQKSIKSKMLNNLADFKSEKPKLRWYSTVTGDLYTEAADALYLYHNMRKPVLTERTFKSIVRDIGMDSFKESYVFLEISCSSIFEMMIKPTIPTAIVMPSIKKQKDEVLQFLSTIGQLYCLGYNINFMAQFDKNEINNFEHNNNKIHYILNHNNNNKSEHNNNNEKQIQFNNFNIKINYEV